MNVVTLRTISIVGRCFEVASRPSATRQDAGDADEPHDPRVRDRERPGHEGASAAVAGGAPGGALCGLPRLPLSRARGPHALDRARDFWAVLATRIPSHPPARREPRFARPPA